MFTKIDCYVGEKYVGQLKRSTNTYVVDAIILLTWSIRKRNPRPLERVECVKAYTTLKMSSTWVQKKEGGLPWKVTFEWYVINFKSLSDFELVKEAQERHNDA